VYLWLNLRFERGAGWWANSAWLTRKREGSAVVSNNSEFWTYLAPGI